MCGIIGFYNLNYSKTDSEFTRKTIDYLMKTTDIRGKDTSGVLLKTDKTKKLIKRNFRSSKLVKDKEYINIMNSVLEKDSTFLSAIGHCRMQTNGSYDNDYNNQPTLKDDTVCVHNGIITNIEKLWQNHSEFDRSYDIDTEFICDYFNQSKANETQYSDLLYEIFNKIYGETTFIISKNGIDDLVFATNTGSSYYLYDESKSMLILASEDSILSSYKKKFNEYVGHLEIHQLLPWHCIIIDENSGKINISKFEDAKYIPNISKREYEFNVNSKMIKKKNVNVETKLIDSEAELLQYDEQKLREMKRCTKCLLPHTFPYIEFDENGVCNYCHNYQKIETQPKQELEDAIKKANKEQDTKFLLTFSGGRDSCYGMHLLDEMGAEFLSYTYDWGMVTDLARRNQSRLCGKLGCEHIIVSADIDKKRLNVKKNVEAWLKRPSLGLVPLFMAGDKHYFYYANKVAKENGMSNLVILCDNPYEVTYFKYGFSGARPKFEKKKQLFRLDIASYAKMLWFYFKEFILNPRFLNRSVFDTFKAFLSYYAIPHNYINLFRFIDWDEKEVDKTLLGEYDWELAPDTQTTWRIGDATAPFYNYIYTTVAGFSENDTFRSNQIREGRITREEGLKLVLRDNKPRYESIKWYLDAIGLDFEDTIKIINNIKKLYK